MIVEIGGIKNVNKLRTSSGYAGYYRVHNTAVLQHALGSLGMVHLTALQFPNLDS